MLSIKKIKESAHKLYDYLDESAEATVSDMRKETELEKEAVHAAIGWLARENKVYRDGDKIVAGEKEDRPTIKRNVELVIRTLNINGKMTVEELGDETGLEKGELWVALGWLARGEKVSISEDGVVKLTLPESA